MHQHAELASGISSQMQALDLGAMGATLLWKARLTAFQFQIEAFAAQLLLQPHSPLQAPAKPWDLEIRSLRSETSNRNTMGVSFITQDASKNWYHFKSLGQKWSLYNQWGQGSPPRSLSVSEGLVFGVWCSCIDPQPARRLSAKASLAAWTQDLPWGFPT